MGDAQRSRLARLSVGVSSARLSGRWPLGYGSRGRTGAPVTSVVRTHGGGRQGWLLLGYRSYLQADTTPAGQSSEPWTIRGLVDNMADMFLSAASSEVWFTTYLAPFTQSAALHVADCLAASSP